MSKAPETSVAMGRKDLAETCLAVVGLLLGGCSAPQPGLKLAVDEVASVTVAEATPGEEERDKARVMVTDREIVARCVAEFNGLSWDGNSGIGKAPFARCFFSDAAGKPIVNLGYMALRSYPLPPDPDEVIEAVINKRNYYTSLQPVPTINRLFAFREIRIKMRILAAYAAETAWDETDRRVAKRTVMEVYAYLPAETRPIPTSPAELTQFLKDHPLPPLSIETLEKLQEYPKFVIFGPR